MHSSGVIGYPSISDNYRLGKLPRVRKTMERRLCVGRVWIFLVLGVILIVLGLVSAGVYFNIDGLTSSRKYTEILPMYINSVSIIISGVSVCLLFWKRLKVLVFLCVVICVASGFLCGLTAILTTTHVLKPLQYFTLCRHYESQHLCQCFSPYRRDMLSLEYSDTAGYLYSYCQLCENKELGNLPPPGGSWFSILCYPFLQRQTEETRYDFQDVGSCDSIQTLLPQLLYTLISIYAAVFLVSIGSAIVALLVLRTERIKRGFFRDEAYEEVYTVSGSSSQDQSDSEVEVSPDVNPIPSGGIPISTKSSTPRNPSNQFETSVVNSAVRGRSITPQNINTTPSIQDTPSLSRAKTLEELGKESLANRYRIAKTPDREFNSVSQRSSKTPDRDLSYNIRQRLSKTPDRELTHRRRSFTNVKRLSRSCDSLDSSGKESNEKLNGFSTAPSEGKKKGKLKDHRRKGKRAATVHTLDTDQLLLILNLQMRYLQETKEQQSNTPRRAVTPQPTTQRPVIPQKVRSHTPQPYGCKGRNTNPNSQISSQTWSMNRNFNQLSSGAKARSESESSSRSCERYIEGSRLADNTIDSANDSDSLSGTVERTQIVNQNRSVNNTIPSIRNGYNPYMQENPTYHKSADQMHYVTYSDSMLNSHTPKLKSRASAQSHFLPPEPLHRGSYQQLPPQPITRQQNGTRPLPPQPLHRGSSAFQIVDRNSKSRSPSIVSDKPLDITTRKSNTPLSNKDYADKAIRENFQLNSRQFILSDTQNNGNGNYEGNFQPSHAMAENSILTYQPSTQTQSSSSYPTENLPPYSGPPSYKEYVSSCDNSVTSSLSSNPEEIYSFPKRNKKKDKKTNDNKNSDQSRSNKGNTDSRERSTILNLDSENVYGNSMIVQGHKSRAGQVQGASRSKGASAEAIYSSPNRSRVKQCIVPENYYAALHKCNKPGEPGRKINKSQETSMLSGYQSEYGNLSDYQDAMYGRSPRIHHQIAPDAKYHEYEDVYDSVEPSPAANDIGSSMAHHQFMFGHNQSEIYLPGSQGKSRDSNAYSVNTHGLAKTKAKSKPKSPRKQAAPFPVSNVNARMPDFMGANTNAVNCQVTQGVQNVHAENMPTIPRIKLNDLEAEDCMEDEVFVDGNPVEADESPIEVYGNPVGLYGNPVKVSETSKPFVQGFVGTNSNDTSSEFGQMTLGQNLSVNSELNTSEQTNESLESSDQETDNGYMKMYLPHKNAKVCSVNPTTNETAYSSHMTSGLTNEEVYSSVNSTTNENTYSSHMTSGLTNEEVYTSHMTGEGTRHVPEGEEREQTVAGDQENYEETGV